MYDSRTDAPRLRHAHKYCRGTWSAPRITAAAEAIAEGLAEYAELLGGAEGAHAAR